MQPHAAGEQLKYNNSETSIMKGDWNQMATGPNVCVCIRVESNVWFVCVYTRYLWIFQPWVSALCCASGSEQFLQKWNIGIGLVWCLHAQMFNFFYLKHQHKHLDFGRLKARNKHQSLAVVEKTGPPRSRRFLLSYVSNWLILLPNLATEAQKGSHVNAVFILRNKLA